MRISTHQITRRQLTIPLRFSKAEGNANLLQVFRWWLDLPGYSKSDDKHFYSDINLWIESIHRQYGEYRFSQLAAAFAVLSPSMTVNMNKRSLRIILDSHRDKRTIIPSIPAYGANVAKAIRILDGDMSALSGEKVNAFYKSIMDLTCKIYPQDQYVCVDGHMVNAYLGKGNRPLKECVEAEEVTSDIKAAVVNLANEFRITPSKMQAILWAAHRRRHGIFDMIDRKDKRQQRLSF